MSPFNAKPRTPRPPLDEAGLFDYAVKALGRRMRTEVELRRLMATRVAPDATGEQTMAAVLARLKEYGYLDDAAYAETYARLRQENDKFGQRRVKQDLQRKGVHADLVDETIEARYGQSDEVQLARQHLERKRIKKPENDKESARVMRRLIAAGFSTTTIYKVLRQWDVPDETLSALENVDLDADCE